MSSSLSLAAVNLVLETKKWQRKYVIGEKKEITTLSMLCNSVPRGGVVVQSFEATLCTSLQSLDILGHVLNVEYL